jgi:4-amino-4-deoxy-L-arabinose transferase-like glycosyltransferase
MQTRPIRIPRPPRANAALAPAALVLLAFALRAHHLAAMSLWSDEDITLDRAQLPLGTLLSRLPVEHVPLYFVFMRGWTRLAGTSDTALRFPSLVFGVAMVALAGYVGARLAGRRSGMLLALLLAINPFQVWYGQEARMYTLLGAFGLGALAAVLRAEARGDGRPAARGWLAAGGLTAAAMYTHYYGALLVFVLFAWACADLARSGRTALRGWGLAGGTAALLFAPWLPHMRGFLSYSGWRPPLPLGDAPWSLVAAWAAGAKTSGNPLRDGMRKLVRHPLHSGTRLDKIMAVRALCYLAVPLAVGGLLLVRTDDYHPRYYFAVLPAFYLAVAAGLAALPDALRRTGVGLVLILAACPLAWMYGNPAFQKQAYGPFLHAVEAAAGHADTVLFLDGPALGLAKRYEMPKSPVKIVNLGSSLNRARAQAEIDAKMAGLAAEYPHLWLAWDGEARGLGGRWLAAHARQVGHWAFQDITLERYEAEGPR